MTVSVKTVEEFIAWTESLQGSMILYRGLADADWDVESSAYRRIRESESVSSETVPAVTFQNYVEHLLDEAGLLGFRERQDRRLSDLELLAELQHFGAATCLIDFTTSALIALWFACKERPDKAGKVIAMATDDIEKFAAVSYEDLGKPVREFLNKGKLWKWEPSNLNNRIVAQQSVFVFGEGKITETLFKTITVAAAHKEKVLKTLEGAMGISEQKLFNDLAGFAQVNAHNKEYERLTAEDFFHIATEFLQRREYQQALERYDKAIELNPQNAEFYNNRGATKYDSGNYQGAIADFNRATELNPNIFSAFNNRGMAKRESGDNLGAVADYDRSIEISPGFAVTYYNRGKAKRDLGDPNGAMADYDRAIQLNQDFSEAYSSRAALKGDLGNFQGASIDCDHAIQLNPVLPEAFLVRGAAKHMLGYHKEAIADCESAIELDPSYAQAFYYRGMARHALGNRKQSAHDFTKALELNPDYAAAYNSRGVEKSYSGDYESAVEDLTRAIEINPEFSTAYSNRGKAKRALGDEGGAQKDFAKAKEFV